MYVYRFMYVYVHCILSIPDMIFETHENNIGAPEPLIRLNECPFKISIVPIFLVTDDVAKFKFQQSPPIISHIFLISR
jgi:hypothetical protein